MRRRAFTLFELLIAVVLLAVFTFTSSQLFMTCIRSTTEARRSEAALFRFDRAVRLLRRDVWDSTAIRVLTPQAIEIQQPDGRSIVWRMDDFKVLTRTEGGTAKEAVKRFPGLDAAFVFRTEAGALVMQVKPQSQEGGPQEFRFISALSVARTHP